MSRTRGAKALLHDAVDATTWLVAEGHDSAGRLARRVASPVPELRAPVAAVDDARHALTHGVLAGVRGVNRAIEALTDAALDAWVDDGAPTAPIPMRSDLIGDRRLTADAAIGLLNGFVGDRLRHGGLDLGMMLRRDGPRTGRVVVLVHGLATTEWCWSLNAESYWGDPEANFGTLLRRDLGLTPVFARYNTGRRVADNGERLAARLEALAAEAPLEELTLLGHSMGGLVSRAAVLAAQRQGHAWLGSLRRVISLGTPHQGAPLAKLTDAANAALAAVDLPATRVLAQILGVRSAGIRDLSWGEVGEADAPLLDQVAWHFLASTITADPSHPAGRLLGDLLVRAPSAEGPRVQRGTFTLDVARFGGIAHHQLQCHPDAYARVLAACR